jgi:hypothetical protein
MDDYGNCRNCGAADYHVDAARGECSCVECGAVYDDARLMVASARYKELYDGTGNRRFQAPLVEHLRSGVYVENAAMAKAELRNEKHSAPYQRATYFAERISQWRGDEPAIPPEDFAEIESLYCRYSSGVGRDGSRWERGHCLSKEDTRQLLWEIDDARRSRKERPYFVKKYLVSAMFMRCLSLCVGIMHGGVCVHATA